MNEAEAQTDGWRPGGVIFDMDGTLFDSEPVHGMAWIEELRALGVGFEPTDYEAWVGVPDRVLAAKLVEQEGLSLTPGELLSRKAERFVEFGEGKFDRFEGIAEALERLRLAGVPMALCTSSTRRDCELSLQWTGLERYFERRVTIDDVTATKPDPDPYRRAAGLLGLEPGECLVVEDSGSGIRSAAGAGCRVIAAGRGAGEDALGLAARVCGTAREAVELAVGVALGEVGL